MPLVTIKLHLEEKNACQPMPIKPKYLINHLVLGGDPTGTGRGGTSIYGRTFDDEIHDDLKHTGS